MLLPYLYFILMCRSLRSSCWPPLLNVIKQWDNYVWEIGEDYVGESRGRRTRWPLCLRRGFAAAACWDCWFESRRAHGHFSLESVGGYRFLRQTDRSSRGAPSSVFISFSVIRFNNNPLQRVSSKRSE
jgi:hypothetical protein